MSYHQLLVRFGNAVAALEAMELRYVEAQTRGGEPPFPAVALRARSREILLQLGDLQMQSFGYYALPYPDEALLHNEGPVGPAGTTAAVRRNLAARIALQHEAVTARVEDWKDELARHLTVPAPDAGDADGTQTRKDETQEKHKDLREK